MILWTDRHRSRPYSQQDHTEILEKLELLQSKLKGADVGGAGLVVSQHHKQLQDDVGICLLKLGR